MKILSEIWHVLHRFVAFGDVVETRSSESFAEVLRVAETFARTHWPVLVQGETGVGKEVVARFIHDGSARRKEPYLALNCGALPPGLFESELFGHERGAFSGANQSSRGIARAAHRGTLFLDEIGDLDLSLQVKLLRFLDSGEVRSVGGLHLDRVDVRIIAATNVALHEAVGRGQFRRDLLERLAVLNLRVPPLRDRPHEIRCLAEGFLVANGCAVEAEWGDLLETYHWPGNVRELKNFCLRASALAQGKITRALVERLIREKREAAELTQASENASFSEGSLADIEKRAILERLSRCRGNRRQAARELGIAKSTLQSKIRHWREDLPRSGTGSFHGPFHDSRSGSRPLD